MVSLHLLTTIVPTILLFTLATALPSPSPNDFLRAREDYSEYENFLSQWLDKQGKSLGKPGDKAKRDQTAFKPHEDTYGDLLAARLKRLGTAN